MSSSSRPPQADDEIRPVIQAQAQTHEDGDWTCHAHLDRTIHGRLCAADRLPHRSPSTALRRRRHRRRVSRLQRAEVLRVPTDDRVVHAAVGTAIADHYDDDRA